MIRLKAELALQRLERGGGAEGVHADDPSVGSDVPLPTERRALHDRNARTHLWRQHACPVGLRLVFENIPRGIDTSGADPLSRQGLVGFNGQAARSRGDEDQPGSPTCLRQDGPFRNARGGGELGTIKRRQGWREDDRCGLRRSCSTYGRLHLVCILGRRSTRPESK